MLFKYLLISFLAVGMALGQISTEVPTDGTSVDPEPTATEGPTTNEPSEGPTTTEQGYTYTEPTPSDEFDCPNNDDGTYPDPEDCKCFFVCTNGYAWAECCPEGLLFDPVRLECDWPENVVCASSFRPTASALLKKFRN